MEFLARTAAITIGVVVGHLICRAMDAAIERRRA